MAQCLAITSHDPWSPDLEGERIEVSSVKIAESRIGRLGIIEISGGVIDSEAFETTTVTFGDKYHGPF